LREFSRSGRQKIKHFRKMWFVKRRDPDPNPSIVKNMVVVCFVQKRDPYSFRSHAQGVLVVKRRNLNDEHSF
jgi:hypothetical protein